MTYSCNHQCFFCSCPWEYHKSGFDKRKELNSKQWKSCIKKLVKMGVSSFAFTGGEPLLKKGIIDIVEFTAKQNVITYITTDDEIIQEKKKPQITFISNGQLVNDSFLDFCKKHNITLSMSLPGISTYAFHVGKNADYQQILNNFTKAKDRGVKTVVNSTVTKKNKDELYETISLALLAGADQLLLNRFLPGGRGMYHCEYLLDKEEIRQMLDTAENVLSLSKRFGSVGTELPLCIFEDKKYEQLSVASTCSAARDFFVIDPSGYARVCNHSQQRLEHYSEIEKMKMNPYWKAFIFQDYHPEMCVDCSLLFHCNGGCREAANVVCNDLKGKDPVFLKELIKPLEKKI